MQGSVILTPRGTAPISGRFEIVGNMLHVSYEGQARAVRIDGADVDFLAQALLRDLWLG
ncbi:hypothetical protein [Paracoccus aminophilus]|uniref:Transposase n=1 Tax=Paracoccus aminophilus JCM 7686 TaxID=1367847 RepID=S5Y6H9_PARAH|nr:hypothetical protein [Paracoccus aminophilus]AGT11220.1 hypothetical protein JCM7686_pAMI5p154 [Paracoccus aminophilus JCM 7686]